MMGGSSVPGFVPQPNLRATRLLAWAVVILLWSAQTLAAPAPGPGGRTGLGPRADHCRDRP